MTISRWVSYGNGMLPGIVIVVLSVVVAWILGGPIAAAIVTCVAICARLIGRLVDARKSVDMLSGGFHA